MVTVGMQTLEKKPRKKRRDKDKPKRAMSAYFVFLNKHRDATQKKNPSWSVTDVTKELAGKWKTVTQSERDECQRVSDEDKARYYREMQNYVPLPDEKEEPPLRFDKDGNRKRRKKDKNAPRKNRSSYIIWAQEYRDKTFRPKANTPDAVSFRDQAAQLGAAWKACTPQQRKKYDDMAEKEAQAYAIKRDAYKAEQKAIALAAREAKRQRLLDEKRAWEATKIAAAQLKEDKKKEKSAQLSPGKARPFGGPSSKAVPKKVVHKEADNVTMAKMRSAVLAVAPSDNAWRAVQDVYGSAPDKVMEAFRNFVDNRKMTNFVPDHRAFMNAVLGYDMAATFMR